MPSPDPAGAAAPPGPTLGSGELAAVGLSRAEEAVYELLVDQSAATYHDLLAMWVDTDGLAELLASLETKGLVARVPGEDDQFTAVAPDVAIETRLLAEEQRLRAAREEARRLADTYYRRNVSPGRTVVELVTGRAALRQRVALVQRAAHKEMHWLNRPPDLHGGGTAAAVLELLAPGVALRVIYDRSAVERPGTLAELGRLTEAGGQARVLPSVPLTLFLADDRLALLTLQPPADPAVRSVPVGSQFEAGLVIYPSGLLEALHALFQGLWQRAVPVTSAVDPVETEQQRLIALLLAGLTDRAIARQLGIGYRTAQRRIAALMRGLGATTRFQAGVKAAIRRQ